MTLHRIQDRAGEPDNNHDWRDPAGHVISETDQSGNVNNNYIYFNGQAVAWIDIGHGVPTKYQYYIHDHLGTTRMITTSTGAVCYDADFFPWGGEQHVFTNSCLQNYKFSGKERDPDTGSDYFGARWFRSTISRFYSPDPIWVDVHRLLDPQQLNLYSYVRGNPLKLTDPTGTKVTLRTCSGSTVSNCFGELQRSLRKEDRVHVHLVEGNGKNGFAKGEFGVTVDNSYKSSSGNFIALQKAANDESAKANIDVLNPTDSFSVRVSLTYSSKSGLGPPTSMSMTPGGDGGFAGYTFFPPGSNSPQPYSNDSDTDMVINNSSDVPQGIAHELRHVVLGDFGRSGLKGVHGVPEVDRQTKAAEDEAAQNEKE